MRPHRPLLCFTSSMIPVWLPSGTAAVAGLVLAAAVPAWGQVQPLPPNAIDVGTDVARRNSVQLLTNRAAQNRQLAEAVAQQRGWALRGGLPSGRRFELMELAGDFPVYYITHNANAAISTAANLIRNTAPYNVNGNGYIVGIWDGGAVMSNHQEFGVRVLIKDGAGVIDHATHVAGTIGAAGVVAQAQGMAPSVGIDSYDWNNDLAEMTSRAATAPNQAGSILLSNHSYGFVRGWQSGSFSGNSGPHWFGTAGEREDRGFGVYDANTVSLDALHYSAPYYLAFKSAGNDRDDGAPAAGTTYYYVSNGFWVSKAYNAATDPRSDGWDNGGYDTIEQQAAAKNIMTVGAVNDAVSGGVRSPAAGTMASFSNWGPTDDGRIKPDIVANGVGLYSSVNTSINSYASYSGTSMSSPNASGTAALLIDYYGELFPSQAMRASTLKGLMIHTATDLGNPGPDYAYGWGLINAEAAALQIKSHFDAPTRRFLYEGTLSAAAPSETYYFDWNGTSSIRATICWTDPAGTAKSGLDNRTPALVNDLDVRIIDPSGFQVYYPFVLDVNNPANLAVVGDNVVDNVEQVVVPAPVPGTYRILVSHKGVLSGGLQTYSLILNGQSLTPPATRIIGLSGNLAFGNVTVGGTAQQTLTIANTGNATLTVSGITYPAGFSGNWAGGTIAAGASQPVTVTFAPTAAQAYSGTITVNSDATSGTNTIAASGTGISGGGGAAAFVTSFVAGTVRNNYSGWVGLQLTVGASPLTVTELGRLMLSGNSGTHAVKLVKASDGQDVAGGSVSLAMSGGTVGQIKYATLANPVVLAANTAYYLMTQETSGGDTWCDMNTTVTTTSVAAVNTAVYGSGPGAWFPIGGSNQTYGPVSLKYGGGGGGTTRIIGLSGNLAFGNVMVGATAQQILTINNTGNATLTVSGISYPAGFSGNWAGGTIAAGASQLVTVTFAPTAAQAYSGTITVNSDATSGTNTIAASGTGISGGGGAATAFVTSFVSGTVRNNYSGWVGLQLTVGASPVTVSELGRLMLSGNSGTHTVKLVKASDGQDVAGGSVSLAMSGGTVGQIKYATLASPVVLAANTAYYLMTQETSGGDTWCDLNTTVTTTSVAAVNTAVYGSGPGAWFPIGGANQTYGPVSLKYGGGGGGTTRIIGLSGNMAFGSVTVGATAQQTLTIANTGNATLTVSGITYPAGFSGNWAGGTIAAGASQPVTVTFAPTAAQAYGGTITVNSDATSGTNTIAASGTGTTGGAATAFVTSFVSGTVRNNYSGWVGLQLTVGASPVTVSELGRLMLSGNSGTHTVKLVKASDGQDVAGGSVSLAMSGGTVGQIKYATLASPVVLAANTAYFLMTQETSGGDTWCDLNTMVTTTSVAAVNTAAYGSGPGAWFPIGGANQTYGPVSLKYGGGGGGTTRIIGLSGNLAFGNVTVGATAQQILTINNTGNATLTVSGISYPAGFSGNWAGGTIAAGASQPVTVTFAPTAAQAYGGTITVNSDATSGTNTIAASGTGTTGGAATAFVTSFVSGTVRNNYSGWVGLQLTVGASPVTVKELGRLMLTGNSGTHTVKLVKASDGQDVAGGSVSLVMSGGTVGQIKYATLASPVVLAANTAYYLMTQETFGGDTWCDLNTTVTTTSVAAVNTAVYGSGPGAWVPIAGANQTYGPVSFKY